MLVEETLLSTNSNQPPVQVVKHNLQIINRNVIAIAEAQGLQLQMELCERLEARDGRVTSSKMPDLLKARFDSEVVNRNLLCLGRAVQVNALQLWPVPAGLSRTTGAGALLQNLAALHQNVLILAQVMVPDVAAMLEDLDEVAGPVRKRPAVKARDDTATINCNLLCMARAVASGSGGSVTVVQSKALPRRTMASCRLQ